MIKGKLVLVPFPFDDLASSKVRPALCLTNTIGNYRHVIVSFISSKVPADLLETDLILDSSHEDFIKTGLRVSSTLKLHRLMTITTDIFKRELGKLSPRIQGEVDSKLKKLFDL